jgi:hypothetical protein
MLILAHNQQNVNDKIKKFVKPNKIFVKGAQ